MDNTAFEYDSGDVKRREERSVSAVYQNMTAEERKREKRQIYKNVLLISFSFLLLFTAFESMSKLQSSINVVDNLGTWSSTSVYISLILSCMFMPSILIKYLKVKWTLVVCIFCYSTYMAAQFYPEFYTLIPTAFILGLGAAPMWSAKCTYLNQVAHRLAALEGLAAELVVVKFFAIFFFFFQCNSILGSIIHSTVLSSGSGNETIVELTDADILGVCGSAYCPAQISSSAADSGAAEEETPGNKNFSTDITKIYIIAGFFLGFSLSAAAIIAIFVDPLTRFGEDERNEGKEELSGVQLLVATFRHMKNKNQLLVIPITIWSGIEQGFFGADFTAGFVTCAYGAHVIGRVVIVFGICNATFSFASGYIIKVVGRPAIFVFGAVMNVIVIAVMLGWAPASDQVYVVYILAAMWGLGDAVWQTQINALYGALFASQEEAAFSNYRMWESLGFVIAFITNSLGVCIYPKIIGVIVFLVLGMLGYFMVEYCEHARKKKQVDNNNSHTY